MRRSKEAGLRPLGLMCLVSTVVWLTACDSGSPTTSAESEPTAAPEATSVVLAEVNGSPITEADVDFTIARTFSRAEQLGADGQLRSKVLDSLVASRAMRQRAEAMLSDQELSHIEQRVRAYEEELLVKAYLQETTEPEPVTVAQVKAYYEENLQLFGAEPLRDFELLRAPSDQDESARDALLDAVAEIRATENWAERQGAWETQFGLRFKAVRGSQRGLLSEPLEKALAALDENETSNVVYLDGQLHLLRLNRLHHAAPDPLSEVSSDIRKILAPRQLKRAVKNASDQATAEADIQYIAR